MRQVIYCRH